MLHKNHLLVVSPQNGTQRPRYFHSRSKDSKTDVKQSLIILVLHLTIYGTPALNMHDTSNYSNVTLPELTQPCLQKE